MRYQIKRLFAVFAVLLVSSAFLWAADQIPVPIKQVKPIYPLWILLSDTQFQGEVLVRFVVNERGVPEKVEAIKSSHRMLGNAAIRAVEQWRFKPGIKDGKPVKTLMQVPILFGFEGFLGETYLEGNIRCLNQQAMIDPPALIAFTSFAYPGKYWRKDVDGAVTAQFQIGKDGKCMEIRVVSATHPEFGESVVKGIAGFRFAKPEETGELPKVQLDIRFLSAPTQSAQRKAAAAQEGKKPKKSTNEEGADSLAATIGSNYSTGAEKFNQAKYDSAIADFDKVIAADPNHSTAYLARGMAKVEKGDAEGAMLDFAKTIQLKPDQDEAFCGRARAKYLLHDFEGAIAEAFKAKELNPECSLAYYCSGLAKEGMGDVDGAIAEYSKAIKLQSNNANAYKARGQAKTKKNDLDGAISDFDILIKLVPNFFDGYNDRGYTKKLKGELDGAIADFDKAIELNPTYARAYYNRGFTKAQKNDGQGAAADITKYHELTKAEASGK